MAKDAMAKGPHLGPWDERPGVLAAEGGPRVTLMEWADEFLVTQRICHMVFGLADGPAGCA